MVILLQSVSCASNLQAGFTSADVGALNLQSFRVEVNCCTVFSGKSVIQTDCQIARLYSVKEGPLCDQKRSYLAIVLLSVYLL